MPQLGKKAMLENPMHIDQHATDSRAPLALEARAAGQDGAAAVVLGLERL